MITLTKRVNKAKTFVRLYRKKYKGFLRGQAQIIVITRKTSKIENYPRDLSQIVHPLV